MRKYIIFGTIFLVGIFAVVALSIKAKNRESVPTKTYSIGILTYTPVLESAANIFKETLDVYAKEHEVAFQYFYGGATLQTVSEGARLLEEIDKDQNIDLFITGQVGASELRKLDSETPIVAMIFSNFDDSNNETNKTESFPQNVVSIEAGAEEVSGDRLFYLTKILPSAKRVFVPRAADGTVYANLKPIPELRKEAQRYGLTLVEKQFFSREELNQYLLQVTPADFDVIMRYPDPFISANIDLLMTMAGQLNINKPVIAAGRKGLELGALFSYGTTYEDMGRYAAKIVSQIIIDEIQPEYFSIQRVNNYQLGINLTTARNFKVEVPAQLLKLADYTIGSVE